MFAHFLSRPITFQHPRILPEHSLYWVLLFNCVYLHLNSHIKGRVKQNLDLLYKQE